MQKRAFLVVVSILIAVITILSWKLCSASDCGTGTASAEKQATFAFSLIDTIVSKELNETRRINVYLPQSYSPDSAKRYPVIYLLDGGVEEDFIHVAGIVRYYNQPWIDRFPESIVVGIENTTRRRDFTFAVKDTAFLGKLGFSSRDFPSYGGSAAFISFLEKELQPFIEKKYKTTKGRTIIGESLGGLLATELLMKHHHLFDTYIIISPSLWWNDGSLLEKRPEPAGTEGKEELKIYIGASKKEEDPPMFDDALRLSLLLKKCGGMQVHFDYLEEETHATISHPAIFHAFRLLFPKKQNNS